MIVLKMIALALGLSFSAFGYFIFFQKKYSLINGFDEAFQAGRKKEADAQRVGLIELIVGIAMLITAVILIIFA